MKVAISGSHGFIGSHLAQALLNKGYSVEPVSQKLLYSPKDLNRFFHELQPDYIFHLGAYGNMAMQKDPSMTVFANVFGTFNMLKESIDIPYKGFINFGSSSEYGKKLTAMNELDLLIPETFYGASKAAATHFAYVYAQQYDKPIVTVRPFSVYGPGEATFRFIPTVIKNILSHTSFPLEPKAVHDWIYIEDFVRALILIMDKAYQFSKINNKVVNIGSGRMRSNREICDDLKKISGIQYLATIMDNLRPRDSEVWMSDNTLLSTMGYVPKFMLMDGLKATFDYYSKLYAEQGFKKKNN